MTTTELAGPAVLGAVRDLVPMLRANGLDAENRRWIPDENIDQLDKAGVFRMAVPRRFGGLELPLVEQAAVLTEIGRGCPSTSWVSMVWVSSTWMATLYPDKAQEEIFNDRSVHVSGGFTPGGTLVPTSGGYLLNGSWRFNTGCHGADWDITAAIVNGPNGPIGESVAIVPMSEMTIADDWHVSSASATGSATSTAKNVFVPAHRVVDAEQAVLGTTGERANTGATGREYGLYAFVLAETVASCVGIARGAYDLFVERLPGRGISYSNWTDQSGHPLTHIQVATAANKITAAQAMLDRMIELIQRRADAGEQLTWAEKADIRGQSAFAIQLTKEAVETLYTASGASVIAKAAPLQRFHRDIQGLSLHGLLQPNTSLEVQGRVLLGLDPNSHYL